ncbi:MAG: cobalt ECF transporter T component CbiQ, partial [Anaerolineales bacterium]|nr:cobalt ECF transporter T component CbiQ [Anaerolineales bacterium]
MTHIHALDTYRPGVGPLHRMDARVKFVASIAFIISAALTPEGAWPAYILLCALALSVGVASSVGMA